MSSHSRFWPHWLLSEATPAHPAVEPGAIFEAINERQTVEVAEIIGTRTDELGVGHVRFRLSYRYQHRTMDAGERTLALASFLSRFNGG
jgi:hypothetical protein